MDNLQIISIAVALLSILTATIERYLYSLKKKNKTLYAAKKEKDILDELNNIIEWGAEDNVTFMRNLLSILRKLKDIFSDQRNSQIVATIKSIKVTDNVPKVFDLVSTENKLKIELIDAADYIPLMNFLKGLDYYLQKDENLDIKLITSHGREISSDFLKKSELVVPIVSSKEEGGDKVMGFLDLESNKENTFSDEDIALLKKVSEIIYKVMDGHFKLNHN